MASRRLAQPERLPLILSYLVERALLCLRRRDDTLSLGSRFTSAYCIALHAQARALDTSDASVLSPPPQHI
eukprot:6183024-Pleurochrysis_carterae.AAC.1